MEGELQSVVSAARQWLKQESAWDSQVYAETPSPLVGEGGDEGPSRNVVPSPKPSPTRGEGTSTATQITHPSDPAKEAALQSLNDQYKDCVRCPLGPTRLKFVFGVGHPNSGVMFIGEGPGYQEDHMGEPFIGKAGQLLDKMMASIGLSRKTNAYIANIVKCHPMINPADPESRGNDRPPTPEEVATCSPILLRQIAVIQPKVIVTLGSPSTKMILKTAEGISKIRGKLYPFAVDAFYPPDLLTEEGNADSAPPRLDAATRTLLAGTQVLPTYHPAALLRNPNLKVDAWTDLKLLRDTFLLKK